MDSRMKDLNRRRAVDTYKIIHQMLSDIDGNVEVKNLSDEEKKKIQEKKDQLLSICRKLPMQIKENDLITVLAYYRKENEDKEKKSIGAKIEKALEEWLIDNFLEEKRYEIKSLISYLTKCDFIEYQLFTKEVIEYAIWLKRNAEGIL